MWPFAETNYWYKRVGVHSASQDMQSWSLDRQLAGNKMELLWSALYTVSRSKVWSPLFPRIIDRHHLMNITVHPKYTLLFSHVANASQNLSAWSCCLRTHRWQMHDTAESLFWSKLRCLKHSSDKVIMSVLGSSGTPSLGLFLKHEHLAQNMPLRKDNRARNKKHANYNFRCIQQLTPLFDQINPASLSKRNNNDAKNKMHKINAAVTHKVSTYRDTHTICTALHNLF